MTENKFQGMLKGYIK